MAEASRSSRLGIRKRFRGFFQSRETSPNPATVAPVADAIASSSPQNKKSKDQAKKGSNSETEILDVLVPKIELRGSGNQQNKTGPEHFGQSQLNVLKDEPNHDTADLVDVQPSTSENKQNDDTTQSDEPPPTDQKALPLGEEMWKRVFDRLKDEDLALLKQFRVSQNGEIMHILTQIKEEAEKQKEACTDRETFDLFGKKVVLRDQAEKLVKWVNKFQPIGDIASAGKPYKHMICRDLTNFNSGSYSCRFAMGWYQAHSSGDQVLFR
jgi:hypothetical protein